MDNEPDREEKCIRFGCGALFGFVAGISFLISLVDVPGIAWFVVVAATMALCGYGAMKQGDAFWSSALGGWYWW